MILRRWTLTGQLTTISIAAASVSQATFPSVSGSGIFEKESPKFFEESLLMKEVRLRMMEDPARISEDPQKTLETVRGILKFSSTISFPESSTMDVVLKSRSGRFRWVDSWSCVFLDASIPDSGRVQSLFLFVDITYNCFYQNYAY